MRVCKPLMRVCYITVCKIAGFRKARLFVLCLQHSNTNGWSGRFCIWVWDFYWDFANICCCFIMGRKQRGASGKIRGNERYRGFFSCDFASLLRSEPEEEILALNSTTEWQRELKWGYRQIKNHTSRFEQEFLPPRINGEYTVFFALILFQLWHQQDSQVVKVVPKGGSKQKNARL